MLYERVFSIDKRLQRLVSLIGEEKHSAAQLAELLGVSIPTVHRDVQALRERGFVIRSENTGNGWRYVFDQHYESHLSGDLRPEPEASAE